MRWRGIRMVNLLLNPLVKFVSEGEKNNKIYGKYEVCGQLKNDFKLIKNEKREVFRKAYCLRGIV